MSKDEVMKYVLEQAKIEVEHTRSWPTKVMAFYVAINFGIVGSLFAAAGRSPSIQAHVCLKYVISAVLVVIACWVLALLKKNHFSYLRYRNIQVQFQRENLEVFREELSLPRDWFIENEISLSTRASGWGFYACIVVIVVSLALLGIWAGA
jgi:hypothetical protein